MIKKIIISIALAVLGKIAMAQTCVLSGFTKNVKDSSIMLYLLTADGHYRHQSVPLKINAGGNFKQTIPLASPLFVLINVGDKERKLLLSPGRDLTVSIDGNKEEFLQMSGVAAVENKLIGQLKLGGLPFFMQDDWEKNRFVRMKEDSLETQLWQPITEKVKNAEKIIAGAVIPASIKKILGSEFVYALQCYLYDFAGNYLRWGKNPAQENVMKRVMDWQPLPGSRELITGFYANMMLSNRQRYSLNELGKSFRTDSVAAKKKIELALQMSYTEIMRQVNVYGERATLPWLLAKQNMPKELQEKILFNKIMENCSDKNLIAASALLDTMHRYFASSTYSGMAEKEVTKMQLVLNKQSANKKIVFYEGSKAASLKELIAPYKGKIVYLDIWGTWCGPCRIEMGFVAELKKRYAGKDIVFVYLDMDDDDKNSRWKEFVYLNAVEGEHYRMNNKEIEGCWKEIGTAGGKTNLYPTYVVFDKEGKIIHANAERPSSKEILYKQLDEVL